MRLLLATLTTAFALTLSAFAAAPADGTVIPLWPEGIPNAKPPADDKPSEKGATTGSLEPVLTYYRPAVDRPTGTTVIVAPGGGYANLSMDREGIQYARWLGTLGVHAFVLRYRLKDYGHPAPLQDVARAMRIVRSRATEFGLQADHIGVMGSSAGGHLAASIGTLFAHPATRTGAALDSVNARPDFLVLMYPVITFEGPATHAGSRRSLLGPDPSPELVALLSVEKQVTEETPPTLLIHTQEDKTVPVENSILFYQALTKAGVPAEMYLFNRGAHGLAMRAGLGTSSEWYRYTETWLRERSLLDPYKP